MSSEVEGVSNLVNDGRHGHGTDGRMNLRIVMARGDERMVVLAGLGGGWMVD